MSHALVVMVALGAGCWLLRVLGVVVLPARLPDRVREGLDLLGPAVLAALVAVGTGSAASGADALTAGLVLATVLATGLVARLTRSLGWAIGTALVGTLLIDLAVL
jgi:branched-subunit amino acid transport protein